MTEKKMTASKENVRKARAIVDDLGNGVAQDTLGFVTPEQYQFLKDVLDACEKKLPTEAAYEKERARKREHGRTKRAKKDPTQWPKPAATATN